MVEESALSFTVEIGTTNRTTIPPEVVRALGIQVGDILQINISKIIHKKEA